MLLHGLTDDGATWGRKADLQAVSDRKGLLIVCPEGHRSFWRDAVGEPAYWSFLTKELPRLVADRFRVPLPGASWSIAGVSMGGYGALMAASKSHGVFGNVGAFSPLTSLANDLDLIPPEMLLPAEKEKFAGGTTQEDLIAMLVNLDRKARVILACGDEDFFAGANRHLYSELNRLGFPHHSAMVKGAQHEWQFWEKCLEQFVEVVYS